ncbi:winged helix-turn-helix transcriptional regulator [Aurantiacibacter poecillastricola]|uniref:winged helix-turn-helix transcriptional regulator n=1 Tax=Aurantiacibacter poecillastricola TaxID=3064385 RepID=UPI00273E7431|nr:winged helix-turn-helix transcriptional regulator [Aurantiacibacter sp. 219JJ12-13]MDP5262084.1 winged helix-turn-helix transcriptional regulator [Aurantiacibacter sp. 219JJ12-13]
MMTKAGAGKIAKSGQGSAQWRTMLLDHAKDVYSNGAAATGNRSAHDELTALLGPMADEAIQIVEAFALGARSSKGVVGEKAKVPPEFEARLSIILNGLAPEAETHQAGEDKEPAFIQHHLWQLLYKVRESAELSYAREIDLVELDRRILFLLRSQGPLVPADISGSVGVDKAQVSRSVKRLLDLKMVDREQIRAPVGLTRKGTTLADRLLRLAELRNRELTFDIGDEELSEFFAVIEKLLQRAVMLYEQERALSHTDVKSLNPFTIDPAYEPGSGSPIVIERARIISPLMTLSAYFSRSGALTFKRLTNLSNFESWVLNEIALDAPIDWNTLVSRLDRDHSQAGRTITALMERSLIERSGKPGRRHGTFRPTDEGRRLFEIIQEASRQRGAFLMAPLSVPEREKFAATFEKVRRNAVVQLERERTFDELGHDLS